MNLTYMYFIPPCIDLIVSLITKNAVECHIIRGGGGGVYFRGGDVCASMCVCAIVRVCHCARVPGGRQCAYNKITPLYKRGDSTGIYCDRILLVFSCHHCKEFKIIFVKRFGQ